MFEMMTGAAPQRAPPSSGLHQWQSMAKASVAQYPGTTPRCTARLMGWVICSRIIRAIDGHDQRVSRGRVVTATFGFGLTNRRCTVTVCRTVKRGSLCRRVGSDLWSAIAAYDMSEPSLLNKVKKQASDCV